MLETWHADPGDDGWVIAALTDEDGGPEGRLGWFALGLAPRLPDLPPRGSVKLAAWILRSSIQGAAPGCYGMVAFLSSLGLSSGVRPVEVLTDPRHGVCAERRLGTRIRDCRAYVECCWWCVDPLRPPTFTDAQPPPA